MPPPAFPVVGRAQQAVDQIAIGVQGRIGLERLGLLQARRQAGEIKICPADQRSGICLGRWLQSVRVQFGVHESVGLAQGPVWGGDIGGHPLAEWLECPPTAALFDRSAGARGFVDSLGRRCARLASRIGRPAVDPGPKILDYTIWQLPGGRHLQHWIEVAQGCQQQAGVGLARHERRSRRSPGEQAVAAVEHKPTHGLSQARRMADLAPIDQHRPDPALEEFDLRALRQRCKATHEQQRRQSHASKSRSTVPCTSVRLKSRPAYR